MLRSTARRYIRAWGDKRIHGKLAFLLPRREKKKKEKQKSPWVNMCICQMETELNCLLSQCNVLNAQRSWRVDEHYVLTTFIIIVYSPGSQSCSGENLCKIINFLGFKSILNYAHLWFWGADYKMCKMSIRLTNIHPCFKWGRGVLVKEKEDSIWIRSMVHGLNEGCKPLSLFIQIHCSLGYYFHIIKKKREYINNKIKCKSIITT